MGGDLGARVSESCGNLQHISEREPDDWDLDPSLHPTTETMFMEKSKQSIRNGMVRKKSQMMLANSNSMGDFTTLKKASSCSTIYIDDSTVSQPNLKNTIKCVSLAIYYHIKNRNSDAILDIFDERKQPLTREAVPVDYDKYNPDHRQIYKFIRTLFNAAQLTAECAIITLVYLERLLTYAEVDTRYVPIKLEILTGQVDSVIKICYMEALVVIVIHQPPSQQFSLSLNTIYQGGYRPWQLETYHTGRHLAGQQSLGRPGCLERRLLSDS